ncbi:peptidoglycan-associated lipoprotein [Niveibacterium umoris]|uniref:Peptidoglycan-associated lipoprotein n=2 Tax=Niveibacterium umoris TaxID=1193620 RepID=A0A840BDZ9_9RHOO|nr:peptidoglycan-associated lipoprotein [Niveibacterium umoris]
MKNMTRGVRSVSLLLCLASASASASDAADAAARKARDDARAVVSGAEAATGPEQSADDARRAAAMAAEQARARQAAAAAGHPDESPHALSLVLESAFPADANQLSADAMRRLDELAALVLAHTLLSPIRVEGHANEPGTDEYRLAIAAHRADLVRDYLVARGVPAGQIETIGSTERTGPLSAACDSGGKRQRASDCADPGSPVITSFKLLHAQ